MGVTEVKNSSTITITCDGPKCTNTVSFKGETEAHLQAVRENPWMDTVRNITTLDQRQFVYCSDVCEINGVTCGHHLKLEEKKLTAIDSNPDFHIKQAAVAARQAQDATKNLKEGKPVTIR